MSTTNQVGYEAVESSCDQVTPDSNQDDPLSLMRYKELQLIAMSLNLPGNLKHGMLVDVIKARRENREADVDRILTEHRGNRKPIQKRLKFSKHGDSSNQERIEAYDGQPLVESACDMTEDGRYERRGEIANSGGTSEGRAKTHHHPRKKPKIVSPQSSAVTRDSAQALPTPPDTPNPYPSQLYGPYAYPMQHLLGNAVGQSLLANYLTKAEPSASTKKDWRYSANDAYGVSSAIQVATPPTPYQHIEREEYKQTITRHLSSSFSTPDSDRTTRRFSPEEPNYTMMHQQSQIPRGSNFGHPYTNQPLLAYANQTPLACPNMLQPGSYASDGYSRLGYQQSSELSNENINRAAHLKKNVIPQGYGQQILQNQRSGEREHTVRNLDDNVLPSVNSNYSAINSTPLTQKEMANSKAWGNSSISSTSTVAQQNYRKYSMYGNNTNVWQYQGAPLNYNGNAESPPNVAHDLTVSSRRIPQEGNLNSMAQGAGKSIPGISQSLPLTSDQAVQSPVRPPPPPYPQDRADYFNPTNDLPGKQLVDSSSQFVDLPVIVERNYTSRTVINAYQPVENGDNQDQPQNCGPTRDNAVSYSTKEVYEPVEKTEEVPDEPECCPSSTYNSIQPTGNNDTSVAYCHDVCRCSMTNQPNQYPCSGVSSSAFCSSLYGSFSPTSQLLSNSCSDCDSVSCPNQSTLYNNSTNQNIGQSSIAQNNQYSVTQGVNYGYDQSQQTMSYNATQNYSYSQYAAQTSIVGLDMNNSPDKNSDGYFQEQVTDDNCPSSYTTQNSLESMWSSVRAPSPELDNPLITPSPKGNELDMQQDSCDGGNVFPGGADIDIGEDQGLSFPNIYDYVMATAGEGEPDAGVELQGSKESSDLGDSPSPDALHVVEMEEEEVETNREAPELAQESLKSGGDSDKEAVEEDEKMKDEESDPLAVTPPKEGPLNLVDTPSEVQEQEVSEASMDKANEEEIDSPKVVHVSKRRTRFCREKSLAIQENVRHYHHRRRRIIKDYPPARGAGTRVKANIPRDQITCPHGKCKWIGRIPALALHVRSAHEDKVVVGEDNSYMIDMKKLNESHRLTFFQEAGGMLYLLALHKRGSLFNITIQSLPGSGRSGAQPSGTKASLEVLLNDGSSQGWRGRVWGLVVPTILFSQKPIPLNPESLQERLWSRGDYLGVDPSNICNAEDGNFCLYVSISLPENAATSSSSIVKKSPYGSPSTSTKLPQGPLSPDSCKTSSSGEHALPGFAKSFSTATTNSSPMSGELAPSSETKNSPKKLEDSSDSSKNGLRDSSDTSIKELDNSSDCSKIESENSSNSSKNELEDSSDHTKNDTVSVKSTDNENTSQSSPQEDLC